jgi:uncharacterized oxidoreductase
MKTSGNTILITGGTSGIGFELASQLFALGNTIIITGRDNARLEAAKNKIPQLHTFQSDVSDPKAIRYLWERAIKEFPDLNILINNAGIMKKINLHDADEDLEKICDEVETNLNGPIRMVKQFLPHLKTKKAAAIMNVSSGLAFVPLPISPVYCSTKAALHSFSQSLRVQLKNTEVRVFELAPPATQTALIDAFASADMKGIALMPVSTMVKIAINGMENDQFEIRPGQSNALKFMSRLAPQFILNQLSKSVDGMLAQAKV